MDAKVRGGAWVASESVVENAGRQRPKCGITGAGDDGDGWRRRGRGLARRYGDDRHRRHEQLKPASHGPSLYDGR
jgi:hypothetical protein